MSGIFRMGQHSPSVQSLGLNEWRALTSPDELRQQLNGKVHLVALGQFGPDFYVNEPCKPSATSGGVAHYWPKGAERKNLDSPVSVTAVLMEVNSLNLVIYKIFEGVGFSGRHLSGRTYATSFAHFMELSKGPQARVKSSPLALGIQELQKQVNHLDDLIAILEPDEDVSEDGWARTRASLIKAIENDPIFQQFQRS